MVRDQRRSTSVEWTSWFATDDSALGSNNWTIAGRLTDDGRPLVANDMHLSVRVPNTWYRATFEWPDILRQPADVVLPAFVAGGTSLVWTWFATAWTYAILIVPILLLPTVLGRPRDPALRVATYVGATSVVLSP